MKDLFRMGLGDGCPDASERGKLELHSSLECYTAGRNEPLDGSGVFAIARHETRDL